MSGETTSSSGFATADLDRACGCHNSRYGIDASWLSSASGRRFNDSTTVRTLIGFWKLRATPKQLGVSEIGFGLMTVLAVAWGVD